MEFKISSSKNPNQIQSNNSKCFTRSSNKLHRFSKRKKVISEQLSTDRLPKDFLDLPIEGRRNLFIISKVGTDAILVETHKTPLSKLYEYQKVSETKLEIIACCDLSLSSIEKDFREKYAKYRIRGSWYKISDSQLSEVLEVFRKNRQDRKFQLSNETSLDNSETIVREEMKMEKVEKQAGKHTSECTDNEQFSLKEDNNEVIEVELLRREADRALYPLRKAKNLLEREKAKTQRKLERVEVMLPLARGRDRQDYEVKIEKIKEEISILSKTTPIEYMIANKIDRFCSYKPPRSDSEDNEEDIDEIDDDDEYEEKRQEVYKTTYLLAGKYGELVEANKMNYAILDGFSKKISLLEGKDNLFNNDIKDLKEFRRIHGEITRILLEDKKKRDIEIESLKQDILTLKTKYEITSEGSVN